MKQYPTHNDIEKCEDEPIHLIPRIQSYGYLFILSDEDLILQYSENAKDLVDTKNNDLSNRHIQDILGADFKSYFRSWKEERIDKESFVFNLKEKTFCCIPSSQESYVSLDIEPIETAWDAGAFQQHMLRLYTKISSSKDLKSLTDKAAVLIQELTGYDRVMIYRFDEKWNGQVLSESKKSHVSESWLGLHYPASDIPKQARELFIKQGVRILENIKDDNSRIVPELNPKTNSLADIGKSHLRGASKFHLEYLTNMGVEGTLTCAIKHNDDLWGLIACHHYAPKFIDNRKRQSLQFLSEMISSQISKRQTELYLENLSKTSIIRSKLIQNLEKDWDVIAGLTAYPIKASDLIECCGFTIIHEDELFSIGHTPTEKNIKYLIESLHTNKSFSKDIFYTICIHKYSIWDNKTAQEFSGILACKLSQQQNEVLIWWRPERLQEIHWGGNPNNKQQDKDQRLNPRKSFEKFSEQVHSTSNPWKDFEISSAKRLTSDIKNIIVTKFGEISMLNKRLNELNKELENFSYSVSHDLRGPLRGIDGFAQILLEDYKDVMDDSGIESLQIIINAADRMNQLMDDILSYSGLSKVRPKFKWLDAKAICKQIIVDNNLKKEYPNTTINIAADLPEIFGDQAMMYQLFANLILNACKYSVIKKKPIVTIDWYISGENNVYQIKDNGIGFDSAHTSKIFDIFTRIVKEEYKGTGVGLAIAQRVVLKHNGDIWAEAKEGEGATFSFYVSTPIED